MKKVIKKNQIIITALAIMIAVAGYINYSESKLGFSEKDDTEETNANAQATEGDSALEDIESLDYDITDGSADGTTEDASTGESVENPGEAVLTGASNYIAEAKLDREQVRSENKESLLEIVNNTGLSDEERQAAVTSMVEITDMVEKESAAEMLLEAKGFENAVVNLTGGTADVLIPMAELSTEQLAQIEDIVTRKTEVSPENIVITPVTATQETN